MTQVQRLATRCNACATSFRVSEEQLAISEGYVRCGRCDTVFNARANLFDLDAPSAPIRPAFDAPAQPGAPIPPAHASGASLDDAAAPEPQTHPVTDDAPDEAAGPAQPAAEFEAEALPTAAAMAASDFEPDAAPGAAHPQAIEPGWGELSTQTIATDRAEPGWDEPDPPESPDPDPDPDPDRMLELLGAGGSSAGASANSTAGATSASTEAPAAQRVAAANFRSLEASRGRPAPPSRLALALAGLATASLLLALPLHWAWVERDALRAQSPRLDTLLATHWPTLARQGWRHLDGLSVASSSLTPTPQGGAYRLELVVHNRNAHELAMPWLDLQLSDAKGQVLVRRALAPAELGLTRPLAGGEQRPLRAVFVLQGEPRAAAGYEIGLFHP